MSRKFRVSTPKIRVAKKILGVAFGGLVAFETIFGAVKLLQYMKQSSTSLHLVYEVGSLKEQGRYEEDKGTLYTKERFACDGIKATLDFDSTISYQVSYYDILDNFISKTDVLTEGYSGEAPINSSYARIQINPLED